MVIQIIVIVIAVLIALATLGNRRTYSGKAWKKIALILLVIGMIIAVIFPDLTNTLANSVGIGRGADLLLYGMTIAFILYVLNSYLHQQDQRDALYRLARKVAIIDANERYDIRNK